MKPERTPAERFLLLAGIVIAIPVTVAAAGAALGACVLLSILIAQGTSSWLIGSWSVVLGVVGGAVAFVGLLFVTGRKVVRG